VSVNLVANTDLRTAQDSGSSSSRSRAASRAVGDIAGVQLGAENYEQDIRFKRASRRRSWASRCCRPRTPLEVIAKVREAIPEIAGPNFRGDEARRAVRRDRVHHDAINEVLRTLTETLLIVIVVIFLFLGSFRSVLIPIVAIPISLVGAVS